MADFYTYRNEVAGRRRKRRLFLILIVVLAALCIGGTAFAANADHWFPLLFPNGNDAALESYVKTSQDAGMTDENENFRLTVDSVLFDESAGTGLISLHLENKKQNSVQPFSVAHRIDGYDNKPDMVWTTLVPCYAAGAGQLAFDVMYGDSGFCGSSFYLHARPKTITGSRARSPCRRAMSRASLCGLRLLTRAARPTARTVSTPPKPCCR